MFSDPGERYLRSRQNLEELSHSLAKADLEKWEQRLKAAKQAGRADLIAAAQVRCEVYQARVSELESRIKVAEIKVKSHIQSQLSVLIQRNHYLSRKIDRTWLAPGCKSALFFDFIDHLLSLPEKEFVIEYLSFKYSIPQSVVQEILESLPAQG